MHALICPVLEPVSFPPVLALCVIPLAVPFQLNFIISLYHAFFFFFFLLAGDSLYDSATRLQIPDLPAFSLECLPNRNSLIYGDLYGIGSEASTIFRGTLRYEGMAYI